VLREIRSDPQALRFTGFVFISMLAYSMQDLILEPFAGIVFDMAPGASTKLASVQHGGVLIGMLLTGAGGTLYARRFGQNVKLWIVLGCFASAIMLAGLAIAAQVGAAWPIRANVFGLGLSNGIFAVAAVGAMLGLASDGQQAGEGARMGVWGAAQAIAFGLGGLFGALLVDRLRSGGGADGAAFGTAFALEALMFVIAALVATATKMARPIVSGKAMEA
jgi:BCD family chlorophyll transporter-like MFS transporter